MVWNEAQILIQISNVVKFIRLLYWLWSNRINPQVPSVAGQSSTFQGQKSFELCAPS